MKNKRFGKLTVIRKTGRDKHNKQKWLCICDCGVKKEFVGSNLGKHSKSCGCLRKEITSQNKKTHGATRTRLYTTWSNMKARCDNPKATNYNHYGGKGITYDESWVDFTVFKDWAESTGYADSLTIDRTDPQGNYCPKNCTWETMVKQSKNKKSTINITIENETKTQQEWADQYGVNHSMISRRLKRGWSPERAVTERSNYNGK